MVVEVIHVDYVPLFEPKGHPPVPRDRHGVMALQFTLQWMEPETGNIDVLWPSAPVENSQDIPQLLDMLRRNPPRRSLIVECFQAPVFERRDH